MQEIKKRRILIASVLKPVDEPRAFEKFGQSLAANGYEVFIAGSEPVSNQTIDSINFLPHKKIKRISLSRILIRFKILSTALKLKPDLLIISTHELLGVALLFRMMSGRKIIYDVQENYFKNILYTNAFPKLLRLLIASLVRFKEIIGSIFLSGFILAEKCYEQELNFTKRNSAVIENKCKLPQGFKRTPIQGSTQLIFTGTLAESTGIFEAINLAKKLHAADSKIKLKIVGYCSLPSALQKIKDEIGLSSFITLQGGDHFISHSEIFEAIACAHFGIISYPLSPHTQDRIPTKLYEYLSCGLPILLQTNPVWEKAVAKNEAMIPFDFGGFHAQDILATMKQKTSYPSVVESQWSSEEARLLSFIKNL